MYYAMLIAAALLLATDFSVNKIYQKIYGVLPKTTLLFNCLLGLFTAVVFAIINICVNGYSFRITWFSLIAATAMSLLCLGYNVIGFQLLKTGGMALYTLFLMVGGMVLPYFYGLAFLDEPFEMLRAVAVLLILVGVVCSNLGEKRVDGKQIAMCVAVFVLNGLVSIVSKVHQTQSAYKSVNSIEFIAVGALLNVCFLVHCIYFLQNTINLPI